MPPLCISNFTEKKYLHPESIYAQEEIFEMLKECIQRGMFEEALEIRKKICPEKIKENNLQYALNILEIYLAEKKRDREVQSFLPMPLRGMKSGINMMK